MTMNARDEQCEATLAALARGGAELDWEQIELHLSTCASCGAGLARFTAAVVEQFAASDLLDGLESAGPMPAGPPIAFPNAAAREERRRRRLWPRFAGAAAAAVAAVAVLTSIFVARSGRGGAGGSSVAAERLPQYVSKLYVLPQRANDIYYNGDLVQVCINVNQPSHVLLEILEGHATTTLLDADAGASAADQCFPYRVTALHARATLRLEAFYGPTRIAREDVTLLPAPPSSSPPPLSFSYYWEKERGDPARSVPWPERLTRRRSATPSTGSPLLSHTSLNHLAVYTTSVYGRAGAGVMRAALPPRAAPRALRSAGARGRGRPRSRCCACCGYPPAGRRRAAGRRR